MRYLGCFLAGGPGPASSPGRDVEAAPAHLCVTAPCRGGWGLVCFCPSGETPEPGIPRGDSAIVRREAIPADASLNL